MKKGRKVVGDAAIPPRERGSRVPNCQDKVPGHIRMAENARELDAVFHALPDLYFRISSDGTILDYRAGRVEDLYLKPEEFIGRRMQNVLPPEVGGRFENAILETDHARKQVTIEYALAVPSGSKFFEARLLRLNDDQLIVVVRDVTERKQAEEAIERSRAELKAIYDNAPIMMCVLNESRQVLYANRAFTEFVGQSENVLKGGRACGVLGCINALDDPRGCGFGKACETCSLRLALEDTLRTGESRWGVEYRATLVLGGVQKDVVLLGSTALIRIAGRTDLLLCLQDATRSKQAEKENEVLGRMASRLAASTEVADMIETVQEGTRELLSWDAHYFAVRRSVNEVFRVLYLVDTIDGQRRVFPPDDWPASALSESLKPLLRGESVLINRAPGGPQPEYVRFGDETRPSASLMFVPVRKGSDVIGILSGQSYLPYRYGPADMRLLERVADLVAPALDRAYAEESLRKSERRFQLAMDAADEGLFDWDVPANHIYRSPKCYAMVGYEAGEIGETTEAWTEHLHPDHRQQMVERIRRILAGELDVYDAEYQFRARGGQWLWLRTRGRVVERDADGRAVRITGTLVDITKYKQEEMHNEVLGEVATALAGCSDVEAMIGVIEEGTNRLLAWDAHYFSVSTSEPDTFRIMRFVDTIDGRKQTFIPEGPHAPGLSEAVLPVLSGRPVLINRNPGEPVEAFNRFGDKDRPSASLMYVPVRSGRAVIGILSVQSYTPFRYGESDLRLLLRVADLVAPALVRAYAEEALGKSEEVFSKGFLASPAPINITRLKDARIIEVNESFEKLMGYRRDEIVGHTAIELGLWLDVREREDALRRLAEDGRVREQEYRYRTKDGRVLVCRYSSEIIELAGEPCGLVTLIDLTERKRAEEALQASERKFRTLFGAMVEGVALHELVRDKEGNPVDYRIIDVNPAYEKQTGLPAEKARGALAGRLYGAESPPYLDVYARVVATGEPEYFETFFRPLQRYFRISVFSPGAGLFATVFEDITDTMRAKEERARLEDQLRQVQKLEAIGQLAAGVAHDFNNLLAVIRSEITRISATGGEDRGIQEPVGVIQQAIAQAEGITRSLLTFSRVMPSEKKRYDLSEVVRESERLLRHVLPARVRLDTDVPSAEACWVMADRTQLQQMLLNLAINARDAMPGGGTLSIVLRGEGDAGAAKADGGASLSPGVVRLCVSDTGVGIPAAVCPRIFEPFFTTKPREEGTGLGLSIVHGIVSDHGGRIEVESQVNAGTTFTISLPCAAPPAPVSEPADLPVARGRGETILLGMGDLFMRGAIASFLESLGYRVILAQDGDPLPTLAASPGAAVRLVVVGRGLPGRGGLECVSEIRSENKNLPVVVLAGDTDVVWDASDDSMILLPEPLSMSGLARAIRHSLDREARGEVSA